MMVLMLVKMRNNGIDVGVRVGNDDDVGVKMRNDDDVGLRARNDGDVRRCEK